MKARLPLSTLLLAALNLALFAGLSTQILRGSKREELLNAPGQTLSAGPLNIDAGQPVANLEAIRNQALFHKTRAFYVAPRAPAVELPPPDYRVAGSMSLPNGPLTAMLVHNQTAARIKVSAGDLLEGWTVAEIGSRKVTLQQGNRSTEIGSTATTRSGINLVPNGQRSTSPTGILRVPAGTGIPIQPTSTGVAPPLRNGEARIYRPPG